MKNKYIKPINLFAGVVIGAFMVSKYGLGLLQNWQFEYNAVVIEYMKVLLGLPAVILFVFLIFFSKFHSAIDYFIRNMRVKYKDVEASTQQAVNKSTDETQVTEKDQAEIIKFSKQDVQEIAESIYNLQADNTNKQKIISNLQDLVTQLANRSELFEFVHLNNILVISTKASLLYLYNNGSRSKELFIDNIKNICIPPMILDKETETFAIHNALLVNGLIENVGQLVKVSEKGKRFLQFIKLIKND